MAALQLTPAEWLLAGLLLAVLVLQAWQLLRGGGAERRLRERLADDLGDLMEQRLAARHRELLIDLHDGLSRQTDRIGEHARADRELLQRGLTSASLQLSRGMQALTQSVDGRLDTLSGQVNQRLDEGFRKTNETFASVMARLATIDEAQKKIDGLTTNVVSLQELLGDKRARGAFGEVQLENLVRNMLPPEAFAFQQVLPNGTRVDCLLTLPAPTGNVAVDAKFPLENYHRMFDDALAELDRRAAQQAFRADVKRHVDAISAKYILPGSTADGAVMFLPAEAVFAELHAYHPEVVAYAQHKRVWIVSPTTLMAVLNTARAVMKDVETRKQIHVIQDALGKLAKDFQRFDERMAALARHIEQASRDVQEVHTSSRKISAHFRRIESVQLDEEDEGGEGNEEGGPGKFTVAGNPRGPATVAGRRGGSPARFDAGQGLPAASSVSSDPF
ncbi:MAG TPA: DNA recombination protein RmuC [Thauera sp.]|jgi:DNA recombination protein RmuC|uniref:DNA recombination protein RmuC n=1 Tax=Thauera sp. TaxID=1905334 RepID=UPI000F9BE8A3|nr:DNA recombination protein RmuC [Thauera sp.]MCB1945252.1 DNA recombination protein RmuC [Thauera sp.]MCP5225319.1 DNA recombination protein RmuC [Thauera sp.]RTL27061.1 MAG: DNA recombination protein RmuC [Rhodocyclaceae bacterium]HRV79566.1 DNA recombination protein RmuC [Thauera sp.]